MAVQEMNDETVSIVGTDLLLPGYRVEHWRTNPAWEEAHLVSMRDTLEPGSIVYDLGAEFGDFTALFAAWGCGVVPVEPSPWYWPAIRETFTLNDLPDPLGAFCGFAASDSAYERTPRRPWPHETAGDFSGRQGFSNVRERPDLQRITVDDLARVVRPPDAITMDVEGAEIDVLRGAERTLRSWRPTLWVSLHPECLERDWGVTAEGFHAVLAGYGYGRELLGVGHEEWWLYEAAG